MKNGQRFYIANRSTGIVTVKYDDASTAKVMQASTQVIFVLMDNSSSNGTWDILNDIINLASGTTGTLAATSGGTGQSSYTTGDILYASSGTALSKLAAGSAGTFLKSNGVAAPSWSSTSGTLAIATKTANYTLTSGDDTILADSSGGSFTLTLPSAASNSGKVFRIKKISSDVDPVTVAASPSTDIHTEGEAVTYQSDGTDWILLARDIPSQYASYTPTFSASWGTTTSVNFRSWRVGPFLEVQGYFIAGTTTAAQAEVSLGFNGTDSNVTTSSDYSTTEVVGDFVTDYASEQWTVLTEASIGELLFARDSVDPLSPMNANEIVSGKIISINAKVRINGWNG
jgi:hypothetical protein